MYHLLVSWKEVPNAWKKMECDLDSLNEGPTQQQVMSQLVIICEVICYSVLLPGQVQH
jgi:hypothetical protein